MPEGMSNANELLLSEQLGIGIAVAIICGLIWLIRWLSKPREETVEYDPWWG